MAAFRAPLVAIKAGLLNVLSIGAAYGVVALVADGGFIGGLVGIDAATPVPPFIPVMMFAILFGLSMDYEVFLLSRIREEYLATGSTSGAVVEGLARTARVITAAAAIMVAVFAAFVLGGEVYTKLIGVGLAAAVLIDATVVRMVLVPAAMQLLGDRNWWARVLSGARHPAARARGSAGPLICGHRSTEHPGAQPRPPPRSLHPRRPARHRGPRREFQPNRDAACLTPRTTSDSPHGERAPRGASVQGVAMRRLGRGFLLALAVAAAGAIPAQVWAHDPPMQHGPNEGHLIGSGAFGNIELLSVERLAETPELVADVAVSPDGNWAFLANWGEPDCAGPEMGGQNSPGRRAPGSSTSATWMTRRQPGSFLPPRTPGRARECRS